MDSLKYVHRLELPEGVVFVRILRAVEEEEYQDGVRVKVVRPALLVSTFKDAVNYGADPDRGVVTYRGRKYSIDRAYAFGHDRFLYDSRHHYDKGYQNEAGDPIDWKAGSRRALDEITERARDMFVESCPEWVRLSERLRIEADLSSAETEATELARKAQVAEARAAALRSRLDSFTVGVVL